MFLKMYGNRYGGIVKPVHIEKTMDIMQKIHFEFTDFDEYVKKGKNCIPTTSAHVKRLQKKLSWDKKKGSHLDHSFLEKLLKEI